MSHPTDAEAFPHPYVAVDLVCLSWSEVAESGYPVQADLLLRLLRRDDDPRGWALPGAYIQVDETVEAAAARVFREKLSTAPAGNAMPLRPFSEIDRDDRRRTIALPTIVLLPPAHVDQAVNPGPWATINSGIEACIDGQAVDLLFDHQQILGAALAELRRRLAAEDVEFLRHLLPEQFALRQLEGAWAAVTGSPASTQAFRRRMLALRRPSGQTWIEPTGAKEERVPRRPGKLYRFTAGP